MGKQESLLTGDIKKIFLQYLLPSIGGMLGTALYVLGDTIIVGQALGAQGLASVNLTLPIFKIINSIGLIFGVGGATALSVSRGQGKNEQANDIFNISFNMSLIFGLVFLLARVLFLDEIVGLLGATEYTFEMVKSYLGIYMYFSLVTILNIVLGVFVRNDGSPKLVMVGILVSSGLNIVLDYIFVYPMGLGIWGAALATGISPIVGILIMASHFLRDRSELKFKLVAINPTHLKRMVSNGFPSFIIEISLGFVIYLFNISILKIQGDVGISAYGIIANLAIVFTAIFTGIGQTIQPIVSINQGAKQKGRMLQAAKYGNITALVCGVSFYMLGLIFPEQLASLFLNEGGEILDITVRGIRLYFIAFIFSGLNIAMTSYIQSKEETRISTFISLLRGSIYIVVLLAILPKRLGMDGIWLTVPLAEILSLVSYSILFKECRDVFKYMFKKLKEVDLLEDINLVETNEYVEDYMATSK